MRALLVLLVLGAALAIAGCGGGSDEAGAVTSCADVDAPGPRTPEPGQAPSEALDASKTYALVFDTSCGSFTIKEA